MHTADRWITSLRVRAERDARVQFCLNRLLDREEAAVMDLGSLAHQVNLSPSRLRHLFKKHLDISPARLIKLVRIARAYHLLAESFLTVKEVMFLVGFSDPSHFSKEYSKLVGEQPSSTRRSQFRRTA